MDNDFRQRLADRKAHFRAQLRQGLVDTQIGQYMVPRKRKVTVQRDASGMLSGAEIDDGHTKRQVRINRGQDGEILGAEVEDN